MWEGGLRFLVELQDVDSSGETGALPEDMRGSGRVDQPGGPQTTSGPSSEQDMPGSGQKGRTWLPLVYAPANIEQPAVLIRRPLQPARPPVPAAQWSIGDRVEVQGPLYCRLKYILD
jgi:hypothetical protein